jgi:anti-anti-sigma factor
LGDTSQYVAVVKLCGEHDLSTALDVQDALDTLYGDVLIDLADCEFIDSTIISVLVRDSQTRQHEGHCLELLVPDDQSTIARTLAVTGLGGLIRIHATSGRPSLPPSSHDDEHPLATEDVVRQAARSSLGGPAARQPDGRQPPRHEGRRNRPGHRD